MFLLLKVEELSHQSLTDLISTVLTGLLWLIIPTDSFALLYHILTERLFKLCFTLPYSRFLEQEADEIGVQLAARVTNILI